MSRGGVVKRTGEIWPLLHRSRIIPFLIRFVPIPRWRAAHVFAANARSSDSAGRSQRSTTNENLASGRPRDVGVKFRVLSVATVVCIFGLITLGGVVRLTGSGLGCPDWPLCHGQIIPPLEYHALIEYSHRMVASFAGVMVVALAFIVLRWHRKQRWLLIPATVGVILLTIQILLGGATVVKELPSELVLAHLAVAEALVACMVMISVIAFGGPAQMPSFWPMQFANNWLPVLALAAAATTYGLLLTGSYVTVAGATVSCGDGWPLCQGEVIPKGSYAWLNMSHRIVSGLVGVLIGGVVVMAWRRSSFHEPLRWAATSVGVLFLIQIGVGASIVTSDFTMSSRLSHLSIATLVWISLAVLAILALFRRVEQGKDGNRV